MSVVSILILILAANSAPVFITRIIGSRWNYPVDGNMRLPDGFPLLGTSKTWRGVAGAVIAATAVAPLIGYSIVIGAAVGALAMLGDLLSSFCKRRMQMPSSAMAPMIDQVPESLIPALVLRNVFALNGVDIVIVVVAFILLEVIFSVIFYRLGVRKHPY